RAHLHTVVTSDGVRLRWFPFHLRYRAWRFDEIESAEPRRYRPLREYGGWGIRFGLGGRAYNVSGDLGVQRVLRSGRRILIGSRDPDALATAIRRGMDDAGRG